MIFSGGPVRIEVRDLQGSERDKISACIGITIAPKGTIVECDQLGNVRLDRTSNLIDIERFGWVDPPLNLAKLVTVQAERERYESPRWSRGGGIHRVAQEPSDRGRKAYDLGDLLNIRSWRKSFGRQPGGSGGKPQAFASISEAVASGIFTRGAGMTERRGLTQFASR